MSLSVTAVTQTLSVLTLLSDGAILIILIILAVYLLNKNKLPPLANKLLALISNQALVAAFIISLSSTLGSLFYSEVAGYEPCKLCWLQRIFMYPLPLLLVLAIGKKDRHVGSYILTLSSIGAILAGYHYLLQIKPDASAPCSVIGYSASCTEHFVLQLGYITIPMMAFTAFTLITLLMIIQNLPLSRSKT